MSDRVGTSGADSAPSVLPIGIDARTDLLAQIDVLIARNEDLADTLARHRITLRQVERERDAAFTRAEGWKSRCQGLAQRITILRTVTDEDVDLAAHHIANQPFCTLNADQCHAVALTILEEFCGRSVPDIGLTDSFPCIECGTPFVGAGRLCPRCYVEVKT